ncbi:uncharacterized protein LOC117644366 isoform X9 [Thrips palmi]|uniref:Uncharacterized protein LOC117644366 isoform X9 n=1 Tax=Thrips palmi TaxID=161013 RepID=A0A6P8YQQ2_THRPL|nr:uncharacterized protein LOC117644366 isoform X9 [Thrips palmi]
MTSVAGLQLDSLASASSERITELFPKCRPRDARDGLSLSLNVGGGASGASGQPSRAQGLQGLQGAPGGNALALANNDHHKILMDSKKGRDSDRLDCDEEADDASASAVDTSDDESNDSDGPAPSLPSPAQAQSQVQSQAQGQSQVQSQSQAQSPLAQAGQAGHENHGKGSSYKLRDSRIIEIAGGREVFCQSRSKPGRKGRHVRERERERETRDRDEANTSKTNKTDPERRVWELRSRCGEAKRQRNSRDLTDMFSSESRGRHRGVLSSRKLSSNAAYEPVPTSAPSLNMGGGEVVVFDDIGEHWRGNGSSSAASTPSPPGHHRAPSHYFKVSTSVSDAENDSLSPDREDEADDTDDIPNSRGVLSSSISGNHLGGNRSSSSRKGSRIIGGLPIADYEGSPRRYGPRQGESSGSHGPSHPTLPSAHSLLSSPSLLTPRPGFPQRVLPDCNLSPPTSTASTTNSTFDYLYEFSETRKVLEEFFKPSTDIPNSEDNSHFQELEYELRRQAGQNASSCNSGSGSAYVGLRLAKAVPEHSGTESPHNEAPSTTNDLISLQEQPENDQENNLMELSTGSGSTEDLGDTEVGLQVMLMKRQISEIERELVQRSSRSKIEDRNDDSEPIDHLTGHVTPSLTSSSIPNNVSGRERDSSYPDPELEALDPLVEFISAQWCAASSSQSTPPPPAPAPHRSQTGGTPDNLPQSLQCRSSVSSLNSGEGVEEVIKDIRMAIQRAKTLPVKSVESEPPQQKASPIWVPRRRNCDSDLRRSTLSGDEHADDDEADTDLETDRLLGQLRTDDIGFYEPQTKGWRKSTKSRTVMPSSQSSSSLSKNGGCSATTPLLSQSKLSSPPHPSLSVAALLSPTTDLSSQPCVPTSANSISSNANSNDLATSSNELTSPDKTPSPRSAAEANALGKNKKDKEAGKKKGRNKEDGRWDPTVLIEGVLFRARYLGSTQLVCEGQPTKTTRMMQAEEAVSRIKALAPDGETQPSTEVDLFISTEKIMVLNTDLKEIMMDHALRTISYIADIGDLVVLMARRRFMPQDDDSDSKLSRTPKMICHVFQSEEAQFIAQSIGQAFQVAYMEFLKANGIEDNSFVKEMDYQEVLNSQEIFGDELQMFAKKEMQKEVVVPKAKGEILGVVIVESGWGSMLPTVVIANLAPAGAAARCGQLNIGDQIIAINGVSLVGLPLSTCQNYIKNSKTQTVVKLTVVPCAPVVEVKIKRPETKYQLGFSVQNGVICSLLRGGIAERGGVRVGHRIIEINNQSVVAVPHEKIVNLLATSVGEILMKTMPTSMFRLLTGQETPIYI